MQEKEEKEKRQEGKKVKGQERGGKELGRRPLRMYMKHSKKKALQWSSPERRLCKQSGSGRAGRASSTDPIGLVKKR